MHTGVLRGLIADAEEPEFNWYRFYSTGRPLLAIDWLYWQGQAMRCSLLPALAAVGQQAGSDGVTEVSFALPSGRLPREP